MSFQILRKFLKEQVVCRAASTVQKRFLQCSQQTLYKRDWNENELSDSDEEFGRPNQSNHRQGFNKPPRRDDFSFQRRPNTQFNNRRESSFDFEALQAPNWSEANLPSFEKNFYNPTETAQNRSDEEISEYRQEHKLTMKGTNIPKPVIEFSDIAFPPNLVKLFEKKNFDKPTPIQAQGWPIALSGRDLVGIGQTGSGKTMGYLLPGIIHANGQAETRRRRGPRIIVLAPTRELVQQIDQVVYEASVGSNLRSACVFGGANKRPQEERLSRMPEICIATPGRLLDFMRTDVVKVDECTYVVLDEADRMLDMGFEPQIRQVFDQIRPDRQTLLWSATWPKDVHRLAEDFVNDPVQLNVGSTELLANANITQEFIFCNYYDINNRITDLIQEEQGKILIFTNTKRQVDDLVSNLRRNRIQAAGIHGDHSQARRDGSLNSFRNGRCNVLIATNVASRGLDVNDVKLVINYSLPENVEDYVHRIGRTGRASNTGRSVSFFTDSNAGLAKPLVRLLEKANQIVPDELRQYTNSSQGSRKPSQYGNNRNYNNRNFNNRRPNRYTSRQDEGDFY